MIILYRWLLWSNRLRVISLLLSFSSLLGSSPNLQIFKILFTRSILKILSFFILHSHLLFSFSILEFPPSPFLNLLFLHHQLLYLHLSFILFLFLIPSLFEYLSHSTIFLILFISLILLFLFLSFYPFFSLFFLPSFLFLSPMCLLLSSLLLFLPSLFEEFLLLFFTLLLFLFKHKCLHTHLIFLKFLSLIIDI